MIYCTQGELTLTPQMLSITIRFVEFNLCLCVGLLVLVFNFSFSDNMTTRLNGGRKSMQLLQNDRWKHWPWVDVWKLYLTACKSSLVVYG
jgi:hypothetical protein